MTRESTIVEVTAVLGPLGFVALAVLALAWAATRVFRAPDYADPEPDQMERAAQARLHPSCERQVMALPRRRGGERVCVVPSYETDPWYRRNGHATTSDEW